MNVGDLLIETFNRSVSLFTIMNPLGAGAIMLSILGHDATKDEIKRISIKNSKAILICMVVLFLLGSYIFDFFGIRVDAVRVFGGIILLVMGFNMVQGFEKKVNHSKQEDEAAHELDDISVVPLAIPIIVGPGLISRVITMSSNGVSTMNYTTACLAFLFVTALNYAILVNMHRIKASIGVNGLKIFNRIMGLVVGAMAIQMIVDGTVTLLSLE